MNEEQIQWRLKERILKMYTLIILHPVEFVKISCSRWNLGQSVISVDATFLMNENGDRAKSVFNFRTDIATN
jgi:hypothetical protein